jgi:ATP-dependent RNA helicase DeaD
MHRVHEVKVNEAEIEAFLPAVYEQLKDLTKNELIKRFASIEFNRFLDYYRNAPDLNVSTGANDRGAERYQTGSRFFINLGKMDNLDKADLLEMLDDCCKVSKRHVGKIDIKGAYSFFEVEQEKAEAIVPGLAGVEFEGRQVRVELTENGQRGGKDRSGKSRSKSNYQRRR